MVPSRFLHGFVLALSLAAFGLPSVSAQGLSSIAASPQGARDAAPVPAKVDDSAKSAAPAAQEKPKVWVAAKGESFAVISKKTGIPMGKLLGMNPDLAKRDGLWVGDKVVLDGPVQAPPTAEDSSPAAQSVKVEKAKRHAKHVVAVQSPEPVTFTTAAPEPVVIEAAPAVVQKRKVAPVESLEDQESVVREMRYVREIVYNPDSVPEINCHQRIVHTLILPEGERIVNVQAGDTRLWGISPIVGKNIIFIKPLMAQKTTNMVVATAIGNLYSFRLTSDMERAPLYTLRVLPPDGEDETATANSGRGVNSPGAGMQYSGGGIPMDTSEVQRLMKETSENAARRAREDEQAKSKLRERSIVESVMKDRNDDFKISYDWRMPFRIQNIFSAAGVTYIRVNVPENRQPVLYIIDESGKRALANQQPSNVDPNLIIVDQTFRKAVLVLDKKEAHIVNAGLEKAIKNAGKKEN